MAKIITEKKDSAQFHCISLGWLNLSIYWIQCPQKEYRIQAETKFAGCTFGFDLEADYAHGTFNHVTLPSKQKVGLIWLHPDATIAAVAHECLHTAHWVLYQQRHVSLGYGTEEIYAYMLGYMVGEICRILFHNK